mgnify:CR=1 FL=1
MEQKSAEGKHVTIQMSNIGGIEEASAEFDPGVTILADRNATNKTSFLRAIMTGLGSKAVSVKSDAEEGSVKLRIGNEEYTRNLERRNGDIVFGGEPYLETADVADLFAFLLPSNEARRTVEFGGDLRDVIMKPVDTEAIQSEIGQLQREKNEIENKIERRKELSDELTRLRQQRTEVENDIEDTRQELTTKKEEFKKTSTDTEQARSKQTELEERIDELRNTQTTLEDVKFRLDSQKQSLSSLEDERDELREAQSELADEKPEELDQLNSEMAQLRSQKQRIESEMNELQSVIQFNEEMLEGDDEEIRLDFDNGESDNVTDKLVESDSIVCWTCGTTVAETRIEKTVDALRELRQSKYSEQTELEKELSDLKEEKSALEEKQRARENVDKKLSEVEEGIETRKKKITDLENQRDQLREEVSDIEAEIQELEQEDRSEVLDLQTEINRLEVELERLEDERDQLTDDINDVETRLDNIDELRERRENIVNQLEELRTRVNRIEEQAIEEFNAHMESVLSILEYDNLDRIWIDQVEKERRKGRQKVEETEFRLHVIRSDDEGVSYEDDFTHLSESEREVTALVFALAGYLTHEVYEDMPFILLDSLESLDAQRIDTLIEYLTDYAEYLVVTLLPEDANNVKDQYQRISEL